ncbi:MAG: VWA domain-containing protein [Chthoniobacteraceae bacterium]
MKFSALHFAAPYWLWLTAGAAVLAVLLFRLSAVRRRRQLAEFADPAHRAALLASHSRVKRFTKNALLFLALMLLGIALARPQWGEIEEEVERKGDDVVFLLDTSKSMLARDVLPSRIERAKMSMLDFLRRNAGGRVGLVAFAGDAFLQCPLTLDYDAFEDSVRELDTEAVLVPGTDIASALFAGRSAFEKTERRKVLVLLTDGEDLQKVGIEAAKKIATEGVTVFTVGVGTPNGGIILVTGSNGVQTPLLDEKDQPVTSRLDEVTLRAIAEATGGSYRRLDSVAGGMADVVSALKDSQLKPVAGFRRRRGIDRYQWPLAIAIFLLVVESVLRTRRRMAPQAA